MIMKVEKIVCLFPVVLLSFLAVAPAFAQEDQGVIMVEEAIRIKLEAELPNVIITINRQQPEIDIGELQRPDEGKIFNASTSIKPRLADIEVSKVKKPKKILAKTRKH